MDENEVIPQNEPAVESEPEAVVTAPLVSPTPVKVVRKSTRPRPVDAVVPMEFVWLMLPIIFMLGLGTGWLLWGGRVSTTATTDSGGATRYTVAEAGNPAIGPEDAPVKIIEFSDYQCPYCKHWYDTVNSRLLKDYEGKIRFVYRDLPLTSIHPEAQGAAEAADCAGEQNAYWKYHDALFTASHGLGAQSYPQYAADLGLDVNAFNTCVAERRYQQEVNNDASVGVSMGLTGTPTFFINGLKVVGSQPYEVFQQIIDNELKTAPAKNQ